MHTPSGARSRTSPSAQGRGGAALLWYPFCSCSSLPFLVTFSQAPITHVLRSSSLSKAHQGYQKGAILWPSSSGQRETFCRGVGHRRTPAVWALKPGGPWTRRRSQGRHGGPRLCAAPSKCVACRGSVPQGGFGSGRAPLSTRAGAIYQGWKVSLMLRESEDKPLLPLEQKKRLVYCTKLAYSRFL
jgi:hypothetical protein